MSYRRHPTYDRVSDLCGRLRSETRAKARRAAVSDLIDLLSDSQNRAALAREASGGEGSEARRRRLEAVWRTALRTVMHAAEQSMEARYKLAREDVVAPFRLVAACHADIPSRGPFVKGAGVGGGGASEATWIGRGRSSLGETEVCDLLRYTLKALARDDVRSVGADVDAMQFLAVLCSRPEHVARFRQPMDISYILSEVQLRIKTKENESIAEAELALLAAKVLANLVYQCAVCLGVSMHTFVRRSVEMVSDWCDAQLRRVGGEGGNIMPYLYSAVSNLLATHAEQAVSVMEDRGSVLLKYAKRSYRNAKDISREALNEYLSAHLLVCEVAGKLKGLLPGDLGDLGAASLDPNQIKALLKLVMSENELASLSDEKTMSLVAVGVRYGGVGSTRSIRNKRKCGESAVVGASHSRPTQTRMQKHEGATIRNPLSKRQRRHLELCARLIRCAQRSSIADAEMRSSDKPEKMLFDQAKELRDSEENRRLGYTLDDSLPSLGECVWVQEVAMPLCLASGTVLSQASVEPASSAQARNSLGNSLSASEEGGIALREASVEEQLYRASSMLRATSSSAKSSDLNPSSTIFYLQLICACAEAFPRGECWSSNTKWRRRINTEHQASIDICYRNFSSPQDVASVIFLASDILATFGGASGDRNVQAWTLLCLLKLSESSALVCHYSKLDTSSSTVVNLVWRRVWNTLFRTDLQYRSYTAHAFRGSLGELVMMLMVEIICSKLTDTSPWVRPELSNEQIPRRNARSPFSFVYEKQVDVWRLPVFGSTSAIHSSLPFELTCALLRHAGLSNEERNELSEPYQYVWHEGAEEDATKLISVGRRFRLLGFCLEYVESAIIAKSENFEATKAAGKCISALISGDGGDLVSSYSIVANRSLRVTEDVSELLHQVDFPTHSYPIWEDFSLRVEDHVEMNARLRRSLHGSGARLFQPCSADDLNEMRKAKTSSADFVAATTGKVLRRFVIRCMMKYLENWPITNEGSDVESDDDKDMKPWEVPIHGRLLAAQVYCVAATCSVEPNEVSVGVDEFSGATCSLLDDAAEEIQSTSRSSYDRIKIALRLLGIFRALVSLSSNGCGAVPRCFGETARRLYDACKSVLCGIHQQNIRPASAESRTERGNSDSDDDSPTRGNLSSAENDSDSFESNEPRRKRMKDAVSNDKHRRPSLVSQNDVVGPSDAREAWLCAAIMAVLQPSYECCLVVTDSLVFPGDSAEETEREISDSIISLALFGTRAAILRFQRLKQFYLKRQASSSRYLVEEQSVFSLLCQVIIQSRRYVDPASPFFLWGFQTSAELLMIAESEESPDGMDERDYEDVILVLNPEQDESNANRKRARSALKTRPYLRAEHLRAATLAFLIGGQKFHEKFDGLFTTKWVIPGLSNLNHQVRSAAVSAVGAALKLLPNQKIIIDDVLAALPPLVFDDKKVVGEEMEAWIMERAGAERSELLEMETDAWRDSMYSLECSAIECRGIIAGSTNDKTLAQKVIFDLINVSWARPTLAHLCLRACERAAVLQGFPSLGVMLLEHDCEWIIQMWFNLERPILSLPFVVTFPWMSHRLLEVQPSDMLSFFFRGHCDDESTGVSRNHSQRSADSFDLGSLRQEVTAEYCERVAPSLIPLILISSPNIEIKENRADKADRRWCYLLEACSLLTGSETDRDIAKLLLVHVHNIYALVLPMLQPDCCEEERNTKIMEKIGKSAFSYLNKFLSEDVISTKGAEEAHTIVRRLLWLSGKSLSYHSGIKLRQSAFMESIGEVADMLKDSSEDWIKGGLFQRAGSSASECLLHSRQWLCKRYTLVDQQRSWDVLSSICLQVLEDANNPVSQGCHIGFGFTVYTLCGILMDVQLFHFRGAVLSVLNQMVEMGLFRAYSSEITPILSRLVFSLLQVHDSSQQEFITKRVATWRESQANVRRSISFCVASSSAEWGWGSGASALEANSSNDTDAKLALSSVGKDELQDLASLMSASYTILERIFFNCPSLTDALQKMGAMPAPTASKIQQKALQSQQEHFSLLALLNAFEKKCTQVETSTSSEIAKFISLHKQHFISRISPLGSMQSMSVEERSLLAGLHQIATVLQHEAKTKERSQQKIYRDLLTVLFSLCDENVADEIRIAASRCLGLLDWFDPTDQSLAELDCEELSDEGTRPLLGVQQKAMRLLASFVQSDKMETAIVAKDTAKTLLSTEEGIALFNSLDMATNLVLRPFISSKRSRRSTAPEVPYAYLNHLASKVGLTYDDLLRDANWCWREPLWKCPEDGDTKFETWIKDVVTAMLLCCYGKTQQSSSRTGIKVLGDFLPSCAAICCQEHQFAAALFPAIVFNLLEADPEENNVDLDPVKREVSVGAPHSDANSTLTRCFSLLLRSFGHSTNPKALGIAIDTLDTLRYTTQIRFQRSTKHKMNQTPPQSSSKPRRSSPTRFRDVTPKVWRGIPFGIVLHLNGPSVVCACIQSKRFASGLFYAELYADNWLGDSRDVFERLSKDIEGVRGNCEHFPRLDISGAGVSAEDSGSDGWDFSDVLSCARCFTSQYSQCLTGLREQDALKGVLTQDLVVNFNQLDGCSPSHETLNNGKDEWRILSEMDTQLQPSAIPSQDGIIAVANQLEQTGLRHILRTYMKGLEACPTETEQLKEKWFHDSWRTLVWDDSLLKDGSNAGSFLTSPRTCVPSLTSSQNINVEQAGVTPANMNGEGFHESLAKAFRCLIGRDEDSYQLHLLQARRSLLKEMYGAIGTESVMTGISNFASLLHTMNQLDSIVDIHFEEKEASGILKLFHISDDKDFVVSDTEVIDSFRPNVSFACKELSLLATEVILRVCSSRIRNPMGVLANHLWLTCSVARCSGRSSSASSSLERLRRLVKMSNHDEKPEEISSELTTSMRLRLEEAKILSCQGDRNSILIAKLVISTLRSTSCGSRENNVEALYSDALLLCGEWMTRSKSESGKIVMTSFLKPAAQTALKIYKRTKTCVDGRRASEAHFSLGEFAAKLFDNVEARVKSLEWKQQGAAAECRKKDLQECNQLQSKEKKGSRQHTDLLYHTSVLEKEVEQDMKERDAVESSMLMYLSLAMKSYVTALSICDPGTCGDVSKHTFRLISLWFNNCHRIGQDGNVNKIIATLQNSIPSFFFVPLTYQIFSRIDDVEVGSTSSSEFQDALKSFVSSMTIDHPYHCVGQLIALANGDKVGTGVNGRQADMYLGHVGSSKIKAARELLSKIKRDSQNSTGKKYVASLVDSYTDLSNSCVDLAMRQTKDFVDTGKTKNIPMSKACAKLANWSIGDFPSPPCVLTKPPLLLPNGDYGGGITDPVGSERVCGFDSHFSITDSGLHRPKIIYCKGSRGGRYRQLVKGEDDIRQDAIMQQVFTTVNKFLRSRSTITHNSLAKTETQDGTLSHFNHRQLKLITYNAIPLSPTSGVLEWVESTLPFKDFLSDSRGKAGAHSRYYPGEWSSRRCIEHIRSADSHEKKRQAYDDIVRNFSPVFRFFFVEKFAHSLQAWYAARTLYTKSCAVNSIVGHVLGIGDRHTQNILIHQKTGEVVHIDFGIVFEQGKVLPTPETVPFRLTRNVVDGMGPFGTEGTFSIAAEATAHVLRENSGALLTILSAVVSDPLFKWALNPIKARRLQLKDESDDERDLFHGSIIKQEDNSFSKSSNDSAGRAIAKINKKLQGYEEGTSGERQSVEGQVQLLINSARDPDNLCALFAGWTPWL